jgi:hypothetical protein
MLHRIPICIDDLNEQRYHRDLDKHPDAGIDEGDEHGASDFFHHH